MECGLLMSFLKETREESPEDPRHLVCYNISSTQVLPFLPSWHAHTYTFLTHSHARNGLKSLNKNSQGKPQFPMGLPNIQSIPSFLAHARSIPSSVGREVPSSAIPSHSVQDSAQPERDREIRAQFWVTGNPTVELKIPGSSS